MPSVLIRPATVEDANELAPRIRDQDREEMRAAHGRAPEYALPLSVRLSTHAWAGEIDGELACLFGVAPLSLMNGVGAPWFIAAPQIEQHQILFLRRSRGVVEQMKRAYPFLTNWVDARNTVAIKWLQWLGFHMEQPQPFGIEGKPFHRFEIDSRV